MSTLFSRIIAGELPGRFVWREETVSAFLSIAPLRPGHTLVVPHAEIDKWTEADPVLLARCMAIAQVIGQGVQRAWAAPRAGLIVAGFEVPHMHVHVSPVWDMDDFDFGRVEMEQDGAKLDDAMHRLRVALRELGHGEHVPAE